MNKKLISLLVAICLVIGLLPVASIADAPEPTTGGALYTLRVKTEAGNPTTTGTVLSVSEYDTAAYLKNGATKTDVVAGDKDDWNAKLIWHTGAEGPTLYLDGFVMSFYDGTKVTNTANNIAMVTDAVAPLSIVLQGDDSELGANYGIFFYNDITIESDKENPATLKGYANRSFMHSYTSGNNVTFDGNVDATIFSSWTNYYGVYVRNAKFDIKGGKVSITAKDAGNSPIAFQTSGDLNISGGADVTLRGASGGFSVKIVGGAAPNINVNDASLVMYCKSQTNKAPIVAEGFCAELQQSESADGSGAKPVTALAGGNNRYYSIIRNHDNLTEHPANEPQVGVAGNSAYWECTKCGKYFSDAEGKQEIAENSWVLDSLPDTTIGATLDEAYSLTLAGTSCELTNYDGAKYYKNATEGAMNKTVIAGSEADWNAKLIWHTGDEGPTLYLKGLIINYYNENGTFAGSTECFLVTDKTAPLTIVLQEEESVINTAYGIWFYDAITIRSDSEKPAKLTAHSYKSFMHSMASGASITINGDVDATVDTFFSAYPYAIELKGAADFNIEGGKVNITSKATETNLLNSAVKVENGNLIIRGGAELNVNAVQVGIRIDNDDKSLLVEDGTLTVYGGTRAMYKSSRGCRWPAVEGDVCALMQGTSADTATKVEAFTASQKYYAVISHTYVGGVCSVCKEAETPSGGDPLDATYNLIFGTTGSYEKTFKLTHYDKPTYIKNEVKANGVRYVTKGDAQEWQAKLIWHTGDEGPTLYMDGLVCDFYNEETSTWYSNNESAITTGSTAPLTIILQGEDSVLKARNGILFNDDTTVISKDDAKLIAYTYYAIMRGMISGATLNINANLDVLSEDYQNGDVGGICTTRADININGGNVTIAADNVQMNPLLTNTSGNVNINGGNVIVKSALNAVATTGTICAAGKVVINNGTVEPVSAGTLGIYGQQGIDINGGTVKFYTPYYGMNAGGPITINGGLVEIYSESGVFYKQPVLGEGITGYAGKNVLDAKAYNPDKDYKAKYVKLGLNVSEPDPSNTPVNPAADPNNPFDNPAAPSIEPTASPTAAPGMKLPKAVTVKVGGVDMRITKFDTPVYVVNTPVEYRDQSTKQKDADGNVMKDADGKEIRIAGNLFQGMKPTITTDANNWNAMFVWKSTEGIPTLYLDGLIIDDYNEDAEKWRAYKNDPLEPAHTTGIETASHQYMRIVLKGKDSEFKISRGIEAKSKLRIESEGDTKLTIWNRRAAIYGSLGMPLVVNANLDMTVHTYVSGNYSHVLMTRNADLTIEGGNINIDVIGNSITGILADGGGDITINGGNIKAKGTWGAGGPNGTIKSSHGKVTINGGTLDITAAYATGIYALTGIDINGGIVNISSPFFGIIAGTRQAIGTINFNGGTTTIIGKNASNMGTSVIVAGPGVYGYAGAGRRSAEPYTGNLKTLQRLMEKPWMMFTDDENKKIDLDDDYEEEDDIITESTEAPTESTAPSASDPSADPTATDATIPEATTPEETTPEDEFYEDEEYDDGYYDYGITPNLNITEGLSEEIPDALIEMGIDSVDMIRDILVEMVWAVDDYSDMFAFFDITLMYHDGEDWVVADEEHYPEDGYITAMLPYPEGTGMDTPFTAVHMYDSDAFGLTPGEVELLMPINTEDGILVELTGLSPVAIAWEGLAEDNFETGDTGIGLYVGLMVVAVLGMAGTVMLDNKKKRKA